MSYQGNPYVYYISIKLEENKNRKIKKNTPPTRWRFRKYKEKLTL